MLVQTVANHPEIGFNKVWPPGQALPDAIATTCHFATCFWLFLDEYNREPSFGEAVDKLGDAQGVVGRMLTHGTRLNKPTRGSLQLTPGSILVFVDNNKPGHSCVATEAQTLCGYNQSTWWSIGGGDHNLSTHTTNHLMWGLKEHVNEVHRTVNAITWYKLYEIPESSAKGVIKGLMK
jgi:hypothetical protein